MATTSIWAVKGGVHSIQRVEAYIENPEKTCTESGRESQYELHQIMDGDQLTAEFSMDDLEHEIACYVSGVNCTVPDEAWKEFAAVYDAWEKPCKGRVCYHGYQSFKEGEVTAQQAHEIGVKLAEQLWGDRFQVVVATHLNTGHYHNHFLLNAISFADGLKFVNRKSDYRKMREVSDALCQEYGLSVIEHAVTEQVWVEDSPAEVHYKIVCRCGKEFNNYDEYVIHDDTALDNGDDTHYSYQNIPYETPAQGHYETKVIQAAYDEQVWVQD